MDKFETLEVTPQTAQAVQEAWASFLELQPSQEVAADAIYTALLLSASDMPQLFTSPRAIQAVRFMNGLNNLIAALPEPTKLRELVDALAFRHLNLEVTARRVVCFRDALVEMLKFELGTEMEGVAIEGLSSLLNYAGGAIIFVRTHYADRIAVIQDTWEKVKGGQSSNSCDINTRPSGELQSETCPRGHKLKRFVTDHNNFTCDRCAQQQPHGAVMRSCRSCDYDVCISCS